MSLAARLVTHRTRRAFVPAAAAVLAACGGAERTPEPASPDPDAPVAVIDRGLATPESVLWDAAHGVWFVSNINGSPNAKDDNGFILRFGPNGEKLDSLPFINGADDDIVLHAPKGLALVGDTLWVTDIDAMRAFHAVTGMPIATVDLAPLGATFLNDVAAAEDGTLYITDSGIRIDASGNVTHPGASRVMTLRGRTARQAVTLPRESAANGIAWHPGLGAWLILGFNTPSVFSWAPGAPAATVLATGPGGGDGLLVLPDGRAVFSSWADSSLHVLDGGTVSRLRGGLNAPADLGYDPARNIVAVPLFLDDRVEFWTLPTVTAP